MMDIDFLRRQAQTCLRLARATFDLTTAERLRYLAAELTAKADELEETDEMEPHMMAGNGSSRNGSTSDSGLS